MALCRFFLFLSFFVNLPFAVTHTLQYIYTAVTPGINFPEYTDVGLVNGEPFVYYDSKIRRYIPKTEWIEKNEGEDYWNGETQKQQGQEEIFKVNVATAMKRFNHTDGVHTLQRMYGCELQDDGSVKGYDVLGYDGEDFLRLESENPTWIAPKPQALITKRRWDETLVYSDISYLENICASWLKKYVSYGRETLERKVRPETSVFQKHSPSSEVVCHATGFFPKTLTITWQKDGEDMHVKARETLPNQDGTYQKRSILTVSAEDLKKHKYTCVIHHSSLEKELVINPPDGGSDGVLIGIIAGVIVGLVILVAVVGFVIWKKKKNSDFKSVPSGDSSSNNSSNKE